MLYVETSVKNDRFDSLPNYETILEELVEVTGIKKECFELIATIDINPAYPIYNKYWKHITESIRKTMSDHDVYLAGRYGNWKYESMEDSMNDGLLISRQILTFNREK